MAGLIRAPGVPRYALSARDVLVAAKAAQYEGGQPADVLWTYAQRYALPVFRQAYASLADLILDHSQPINPRWRRDGYFCRPGGEYAGTDHCSEHALARRDAAARARWEDLDPVVRATTLAWAAGQLPNPVPRAVDFADPAVAQNFLDHHAGSRIIKRAGNWFVATAESLRWPDGYVSIESSSSTLMWGVGLGLLASAAWFGWQAWSRR